MLVFIADSVSSNCCRDTIGDTFVNDDAADDNTNSKCNGSFDVSIDDDDDDADDSDDVIVSAELAERALRRSEFEGDETDDDDTSDGGVVTSNNSSFLFSFVSSYKAANNNI